MQTQGADSYLSALVGASYPPAESASDRSGAMQRRWIVRSRKALSEETARDLQSKLNENARARLMALNLDRPDIIRLAIVRIDEIHLVLETQFPDPSSACGDEAMIATWAALRDVDLCVQIDDLEGLPRRLWFQLEALA